MLLILLSDVRKTPYVSISERVSVIPKNEAGNGIARSKDQRCLTALCGISAVELGENSTGIIGASSSSMMRKLN